MPELKIEPQDDQEQPISPVVLRVGCIFLGLFLGFSFYILSYANLLAILGETPGSEEHVIGEFTLSILMWTLMGATLPTWFIRDAISGTFEFVRGSERRFSFIRIGISGLIFFLFLIIYWKLLEFIVQILDSLFGG